MSNLNLSFVKVSEEASFSKAFRKEDKHVVYKVNHNMAEVSNILDVEREMDEFFRSMILDALPPTSSDQDLVSVSVSSADLKEPIYLAYRKVSSFKSSGFLSAISKVSQSAKTFLQHGEVEMSLSIVPNVVGGINPTAPARTISHQKQSVAVIWNQDFSCFFRAFAVAEVYSRQTIQFDRKKIRQNMNHQTLIAGNWAQHCARQLNQSVEFTDFEVIQEKLLPDYRLFIFNGVTKRDLYYSGNQHGKTPIYIEYLPENDDHEIGHFNAIVNVDGYVDGDWCILCLKRYNRRPGHRCPKKCGQCGKPGQCESIGFVMATCSDCNYQFNSIDCYNHHFITGQCAWKKKCDRCERRYNPKLKKKHKCEEYTCGHCHTDYVIQPHYCYLSKPNEDSVQAEDQRYRQFIFFDIEARQERMQNGRAFHDPNLLVSSTVCQECYDFETKEQNEDRICQCEGKQVFWGTDCVKHFVAYLIDTILPKCDPETIHNSRSAEPYYAFVIAHNMRAYDGQFLLRELLDRQINRLSLVASGHKIQKIQIGTYLRLMDSLLFFQQPLAALPKAFGFEGEKGIFPHAFNRRENEEYDGALPDISWWKSESMKPQDAQKLLLWYTSEQQRFINECISYNFKDEILKYCIDDTLILQKAFMTFWKIVKEKTAIPASDTYSGNVNGIDPVTRRFTLASIAMETFRRNIMPDGNSIAITPTGGYWRDDQSIKSSIKENVWITRMTEEYPDIVRQYRIGNFEVDGASPSTKKVFEYYGDFWHGCPRHHPREGPRYARTKKREKIIRNLGWELVVKWECDDDEDITDTSYLRDCFKAIKDYGSVDMKQAMLGGRTNNIGFYHECKEDEEICYRDITSLYPSVEVKYAFPVNHPKVISHDFDYSSGAYTGLIKAIVIPPQQLHISILPMVIRGKQLYPLCQTCAENEQQTSCQHTEEERQLVSTWTTPELYKALSRGYVLKRIIQVYHYTELRSDIFSNYVRIFLKMKTEASGFPKHLKTDEEKLAWIEEFSLKEGVELCFEDMHENAALRNSSSTHYGVNSLSRGIFLKLRSSPNMQDSFKSYMIQPLNSSPKFYTMRRLCL